MTLQPYSVLLLYPDYIANNYGQETYFTHIEATRPADAAKFAQCQLALEFDDGGGAPDDFFVLLVIEGHHSDVNIP